MGKRARRRSGAPVSFAESKRAGGGNTILFLIELKQDRRGPPRFSPQNRSGRKKPHILSIELEQGKQDQHRAAERCERDRNGAGKTSADRFSEPNPREMDCDRDQQNRERAEADRARSDAGCRPVERKSQSQRAGLSGGECA